MLKAKNILLGVTGSIAVYKSVEIVRRLTEEGAGVTVIMTDAACRFITPLILESVSARPVYTGLFKAPLSHINLAKESDLLLVAPASANTINKFACGIADNLLATVWLAYEGPVLLAPAMNSAMYKNPIVQKSIRELKKIGVTFTGPESGGLACGDEGIGRMADVPDIIDDVRFALSPKDLTGHKILVTAGPTREHIDAVRFISNRSSGKMGFAIARAARRRGAEVTLISGPSSLNPPRGVSFVSVESADEMEKAVLKNLQGKTSLIMAAAVSDFAPSAISKSKIPKTNWLSVDLKATPDILKKIGAKKGRLFLVGFAAETGRDIKRAQDKLKSKNLDLIVLNDVTRKGAGFDADTNIVTIIDRKGKITDYPLMKKEEVANIILDRMLQLSPKKNS